MSWRGMQRVERIARSFSSRWLMGYARGKLWSDPVYRASGERIGSSPLPLLDLGCGMGLHAFYLREVGFTGAVLGLDSDERKITDGSAAAARGGYRNVSLQVGDARELPPFAGHVAMLDVLQYLPLERQGAVLDALAQRVAPGAWCIIRTTPSDGGWRFRMTERLERFARWNSWMAQPAIAFSSLESVVAHFPGAQFEKEVRPLWGWTPFNSWLLAFRRHEQSHCGSTIDAVAPRLEI